MARSVRAAHHRRPHAPHPPAVDSNCTPISRVSATTFPHDPSAPDPKDPSNPNISTGSVSLPDGAMSNASVRSSEESE
eukprot:352864-Rhodomonas_salina.1